MKRLSLEQARQAALEALITFAIMFGIAFAGWAQGLAALPDLDAAGAAVRAAALGGLTAAAKGVVWFLTGTQSPS